MPEPADPAEAKTHVLDVEDAEIVHGPDVIAAEVSGALRDADGFGMPQIRPPLPDALSARPAEVDEKAGSAEVPKPAGTPGPA